MTLVFASSSGLFSGRTRSWCDVRAGSSLDTWRQVKKHSVILNACWLSGNVWRVPGCCFKWSNQIFCSLRIRAFMVRWWPQWCWQCFLTEMEFCREWEISACITAHARSWKWKKKAAVEHDAECQNVLMMKSTCKFETLNAKSDMMSLVNWS